MRKAHNEHNETGEDVPILEFAYESEPLSFCGTFRSNPKSYIYMG